MNERNVAALERIITTYGLGDEDGWVECPGGARVLWNRRIAEELASHGVLVPEALTDDQCHTIADEGLGFPTRCRAAAQRIAKGDW